MKQPDAAQTGKAQKHRQQSREFERTSRQRGF